MRPLTPPPPHPAPRLQGQAAGEGLPICLHWARGGQGPRARAPGRWGGDPGQQLRTCPGDRGREGAQGLSSGYSWSLSQRGRASRRQRSCCLACPGSSYEPNGDMTPQATLRPESRVNTKVAPQGAPGPLVHAGTRHQRVTTGASAWAPESRGLPQGRGWVCRSRGRPARAGHSGQKHPMWLSGNIWPHVPEAAKASSPRLAPR